MFKERIKRALITATTLAALTVAALTLNPSPASAFDGGSGGGSGSGGGGGLPSSWRWVYSNSLDGLRNAPGIGAHGGAQQYVTDSSGGVALWNNYCLSPNLVRVYWIQNSQYVVSMNSGGLSQPWNYPAGGDSIDQYASTINYRGTYIICVVNSVERITKPEVDHRIRDGATTVTGITAWNAQVSSELNDADGVDPIGANNLNGQLATKESNFGRLANAIAKEGAGSYDGKLVEFQNAIAKDASEGHATLELNEKNKQGIAEGGVLSVSEFTHRATVALSQSWSESRTRNVTCDYKPGGQELATPSNCSYGEWSPWSEDSGSRTHRIGSPLTTPQNTAFYQIVSVHCNPAELAAALAAYGIEGRDYTMVRQFEADRKITAILYTTSQAKRPTGPDAKIFGVKSVSSPALARTGDLGFYDKECTAQCSTDPSGSGASTANGAVSNASETSNRSDGGNGGAVYDGSNSNYFEMFRDNDPRRITVNTAYPTGDWKTFDYKGEAPIATTVTMWSGSTPGAPKAAGGGQFTISAVNGSGTKKLFTGNTAPTTQTNFTLTSGRPVQAFSGPYATKIAGPYRTFEVGGTWASEATKPVVLNVKWEYQPQTLVLLPFNVGFTSDGKATTATNAGTRYQKIDVACYAAFGDTTSAPAAYDAARYTGTGTTNSVDANILDAAMVDGTNARQDHQNLVVRFVRGVAE